MGHICTHTHTHRETRGLLTGLIMLKDKAQINHTAAKIMKCSCVQITQNYRKQKPAKALAEMAQKSFNYIEHATGNRSSSSSSSCRTRMSESATAADPFWEEGRVRWGNNYASIWGWQLLIFAFKVSHLVIYERIWGNQVLP